MHLIRGNWRRRMIGCAGLFVLAGVGWLIFATIAPVDRIGDTRHRLYHARIWKTRELTLRQVAREIERDAGVKVIVHQQRLTDAGWDEHSRVAVGRKDNWYYKLRYLHFGDLRVVPLIDDDGCVHLTSEAGVDDFIVSRHYSFAWLRSMGIKQPRVMERSVGVGFEGTPEELRDLVRNLSSFRTPSQEVRGSMGAP
jgi:hypothetical protein